MEKEGNMELSVLFLSCRRLDLLRRTFTAIKNHFQNTETHVRPVWICFDNGSSAEDRRLLADMEFDELILSSDNIGIGPAMNRLIASVRTEYFLNLQDDWLLENPTQIPFVSQCIKILDSDNKIAQVKLDTYHFLNFKDRALYDGPFHTPDRTGQFFIQNPKLLWGGFTFPPAIAKADALYKVGPFREDRPFQRGWAESEYSGRSSQTYVVAKSPEMLLFRHIGDESCTGWQDSQQAKSPTESPVPPPSPPHNISNHGISIIMVVHNALDMVRMSTLKTLRHTNPTKANLIVVNNASDDGTEAWLNILAKRGDIQLIRNETNVGHGPALEQARAYSQSPILVTLDSDAFPISDNWLESLLSRLSATVKVVGIQHHRDYIHPSCLMIARETLDKLKLTFLNERMQASGFDVAERISHQVRASGFETCGLKITSFQKKGSQSEPIYLGSEYEDIVHHQWYTTRALKEHEVYVDDTLHSDIDQCLANSISRYTSEMRDVNIIIGVRLLEEVPERLRNLRACLQALNMQTLSRHKYRIVVVEQDKIQRIPKDLFPYIDRYIFAYNSGAYNRGWAFNVGATIDSKSRALWFVDSDVIPQMDLLEQLLKHFEQGTRAICPYDEIFFLDEKSSKGTINHFAMHSNLEYPSPQGSITVGSQGLMFFIESHFYSQIGGHDERFRGWGREDRAFWNRVEKKLPILRMKQKAFHLFHSPADINEADLKHNALVFEQLETESIPSKNAIGSLHLYESERSTP